MPIQLTWSYLMLALMSLSGFAMIYYFIGAMFVTRRMKRAGVGSSWTPFSLAALIYCVSLTGYLLLNR
jgi:hypothetical protein